MTPLFKYALASAGRVALFAITILLGLTAAGLAAAPAPALPQLVNARLSLTEGRARLILDLTGPAEFAIVSLDAPNRIAIDVKASSVNLSAPPSTSGTGMISTYSVDMAAAERARTMLTLTEPAQVQQAYVLHPFADQPARLVVDLIPATPQEFAAKVAADFAASPTNTAAPLTDVSTAPGASDLPLKPAYDNSMASITPGQPVPEKTRPLVVIDPGHGGIDSGASAPNGMMEKNIVLAFALKLQALLVKSGRFDVALTRTDDTYLTLEERVNLARQNKADLFISLHADTFQQADIHGTSIYTRDEQATDVLDKVLAANENKSDIVAGYVPPKSNPQVVDMLVDLMRRQMRRQSYLAAESIVRELQPSVALRRFPVRQADFFVLQAPDVPSCLIELGFLSNADDIGHLVKPEWQDRVAEALARGIGSYFNSLTDDGTSQLAGAVQPAPAAP
jgi:N-acetylmuramoyl-L-alanine amidase